MKTKTILITGTSSGFGWLTARTCASRGYTVYAAMRNTKRSNADKARELGGVTNIKILDLDVTDPKSVVSAIAVIMDTEGRIDVLINNAGVYAVGIAETYTENDLERVMDVNVKGNWRMMKAVLPIMRRQNEGLIINVSSVSGRFSPPFMSLYNSSKFALEGLTEGLHYEVRPLGIDVVLIQPGAFPTEIFGKIMSGSDSNIAQGYGALANVPAELGAGVMTMFEATKPDPQRVADAIVNLIHTPRGQRPLRTVVDNATGKLVEKANQLVQEQFASFMTAFGMQDMMK